MLSKGDLGVAYLIAIGVGIFGSLTSGLLLPLEAGGLHISTDSVFGIVSGLLVASGFLLAGIVLRNEAFAGERVWHVAKWSAAGLGVPTILTVYFIMFHPGSLATLGWRSVAVINIAGGGIVGILAGSIIELRAEHDRTKALNQRNTVFLRLFRHDIRNSLNTIIGHVGLIASDESSRSVEVVREHVDQILQLSDAARQLDDLESMTASEPIDLVAIVEDQVGTFRRSAPEATIEAELPPSATVLANELLGSVVDNLLRNAIEHNDGEPVVRVTVERDGRFVELRVRDDGPGFSEDELAVQKKAIETSLQHSNGVGLWLTRWIVDSYDGALSIENDGGDGATVTVRLRAADPGSD